MYPVLIELGAFRLHTYGVVVAVAVLAALWLAGREMRRQGLPEDALDRVGIPVFVAGLLGARLVYVLGWEPQLLRDDPLGVIAVWRGGLALHGGLAAGLAAGVWACRRHGLPAARLADAVAPGVLLGQAIGRIGCLLSGDSYGAPARAPWAIVFTDPAALAPLGVPLHPVQVYEAGLDLILLGALWAVRKRLASDGALFLLYAAGYGVVRAVTETSRGDRVELGMGVSLLQAVSLAVVAAALVALAWRGWPRRVEA